mgnify:CR=1 FL=1
MKKYSYIDLEDAIYQAWRTSDDLNLFYEHHGDHPKPMTGDEVSIMILGLKRLHDMRMEFLMDMFCRVHKLDQYCDDPEKLQAREKLFGEISTKKKGKKNGKSNIEV